MSEVTRSKQELQAMWALPLEVKILKTQQRVREWVDHWGVDGVYISFSGGKDSTVLLDIVRRIYPEVEAVFVNTGLEYPEIQKFVKQFDNTLILRPEMRFDEVITKYGYPIFGKEIAHVLYYAKRGWQWALNQLDGLTANGLPSEFARSMYAKYKPVKDLDFYISDKCCDVMKKRPLHQFYKQTGKCAITASMAQESKRRESNWITYGCNLFDAKIPVSNPMSFWTEQDVLQYIQEFNLRIAPVYGEIHSGIVTTRKHGQPRKKEERLLMTGCSRTGCIFCSFGICFEKTKKETRFEMLKRTHPVQYDYCMSGGKHNEEGIWVPSKEGLGMKYVFDSLNNIYGDRFIRY